MSATALSLPPRPGGRPSNARLQLEANTLRAALATVTEERDELDMELRAWVDERRRVAAEMLDIARRGQRAIALGGRATQHLAALERLAQRESVRARAPEATTA